MMKFKAILAALLVATSIQAQTPTKRITLDIGRPENTFVLGPISRGATEYIEANLFVRGTAYPTNDLDGYIFYSDNVTSTNGVYIYNTGSATVNGKVYFQMSTSDSLGLSTNSNQYPYTNHCQVVLTNATQTFVWDHGKLILRWDPALQGAGVADTYSFALNEQDPKSIHKDGTVAMEADLNMAGFSVTNIASSSIGFADGTSFGSANVILWNSVTNSGAGTITNIVAGTGLTGGGTNSSVTIDVDTNSIAERAWATAQFVDAAGDSMSGNLDMGNNNITNINDIKDNSNYTAIDVGGRVIYYTDGVAKVVNASSLTLAGAAGGVWKLAAGDSPSALQDIVDVGWVQGQSYLTSESDIGVTNLVAGDDIVLDGTREVTINADTNSLAQRGWVLAQNLNAAYTEWFTPTDFDASTNLTITHNLGERVVAQLRDESSNQVYITSQLFNDSVVWNMTPYASMTGFAVVVADTNAINASAFADKKTSAVITSSPYTAGTADWLYIDDDTVGAAVTVNLPAAASSSEQVYYIKKMGTTGDITIDGDGAETIDGSTTITLTLQYESVILHTTGSSVAGSHWHIH